MRRKLQAEQPEPGVLLRIAKAYRRYLEAGIIALRVHVSPIYLWAQANFQPHMLFSSGVIDTDNARDRVRNVNDHYDAYHQTTSSLAPMCWGRCR
ncbi:hypothetical protein FHL15_002872 [Xylaria flabelliformis]|uniref:Uncharacterized protein n=1 Tax=Xylaria flabelliformis TaxID=2512241 RepID=A0A553I7I0_9PEZI|nr:hypothetical protein FHL15_002872 [Xylaria flabelliformis]